ncbi:MAG: hypothetical protein AB8G18_12760 [Gammaproteobacteria bacterium]
MTSDSSKGPQGRVTSQPRQHDVSIDALADDLFGLNWRAIKTLGVAFAHPGRYSEAAWSSSWQDQFTPSFRLWFTLVAVLFFFQFFWADADGALIAMYTAQMESSAVSLPDGVSARDASQYFARVNFTILPFASAFGLFILGAVYRAWGTAVPLVVRIRYVFAVTVPSTALSLPVFWMLGYVPHTHATYFLFFSWLFPIPVNALIAYCGTFSQLAGGSRIWRSIALALMLFVAMASSGLISSVLAGVWITLMHGV